MCYVSPVSSLFTAPQSWEWASVRHRYRRLEINCSLQYTHIPITWCQERFINYSIALAVSSTLVESPKERIHKFQLISLHLQFAIFFFSIFCTGLGFNHFQAFDCECDGVVFVCRHNIRSTLNAHLGVILFWMAYAQINKIWIEFKRFQWKGSYFNGSMFNCRRRSNAPLTRSLNLLNHY